MCYDNMVLVWAAVQTFCTARFCHRQGETSDKFPAGFPFILRPRCLHGGRSSANAVKGREPWKR